MKNSEVFSNIRVTYENSVTINTGNFQNIRPAFGVSADVAEGVSPTEAAARLEALVDAWLEKKVDAIRAEMDS